MGLGVLLWATLHPGGAAEAKGPRSGPTAPGGPTSQPTPSDDPSGAPPASAAPTPGLSLAEAIEITLAQNPNIEIARLSIEAAEGGLMVESAVFDPITNASLSREHLETPTSETAVTDSESLVGGVSASWTLRSGQSLDTSLELEWLESDDGSTPDPDGANSATISFTLRQPLLQGRSKAAVTGSETATSHQLERTRFDSAHTAASTLRQMVTQYWRTRAAMLDLEILRGDEQRSRELLSQFERLVEAKVTPAADLLQLEADLVSAEVSRIEGELTLERELRLLARELGLDPNEAATLPMPNAPLPEVGHGLQAPLAAELVELAFDKRQDLRATREQLAAGQALLAVAEDGLRPVLDLTLTPSYRGFVDGDGLGEWIEPLWRHTAGPSIAVGLVYAWPLKNRAARGREIQARASLEQNRSGLERLRQDIAARVPNALDAVLRQTAALDKLGRAIELFEQTVQNEQKKQQAGSATLIDIIDQRDRLLTARQSLVNAQLALAIALVDLRFQTGTLVELDGVSMSVSHESATTIPFPRTPSTP